MSLNEAQRTCQIRITYTPKQARTARQMRLELHAKSGSNCTRNQAQTAREISLKLQAKSGSNCTPNQAQTTRQLRLKLHAKSGSNYTPNQAQTARQIRPLIRAACYKYAAKKREKKHERAYPLSQTLLRRKGNSPKI